MPVAELNAVKPMMGFAMTTAFVIGSIIGIAIFMLPIALAPLGVNAIAGWIVSSIGAICLGLPLARLARGGGGIQAAIGETFGSTVAFIVTWTMWVSNWSGVGAIAVGAASTISRIFPLFASPTNVALLAVAFIAITVPINARGVRASGSLAIVTVLLRILPLVAVVVLVAAKAAFHRPLERLWDQPLTISGIATATALTLFALTGFENVSAPVGKVRNSERVIPRALLIGLTLVALLYLVSSTSVTLLLSPEQLANSPAPYADALGASWGEIAAYLSVVAIAISAFGCIGCTVMAGGELCYSMALRGDLPRGLARTNAKGTPVLGQIVSAGLAILLVLANSSRTTAGLFTFIILVSTVAVLVLYVVAGLATGVRERSTGVRALVVAGIVFAAFAFYGSGLEASLWGLGLAMSAFPVRAISRLLNGSSPVAAVIPIAPPESAS
jgi:basic amino acid/polyamine antiporter, APA family